MFKSLTDSVRSLLQTNTDEAGQSPGRKRKRPAIVVEEDDSDVEIVSVKKPRKEASGSGPSFFSRLALPVSMMSDWVRRKIAYTDPFISHPVHNKGTLRNSDNVQSSENQRLLPACSTVSTNGTTSHLYTQSINSLARPPIHTRNGEGLNGDMPVIMRQPVCGSSAHSSRRSSVSSSRTGSGKRSTVDQCFHSVQLREKEEYQKLIQQHVNLNIGVTYHHTDHSVDQRPVSNSDYRGHRSDSCSSASQSNSSWLSGSFRSDVSQAPPRIRASPSRVLRATSALTSYTISDGVSASSAADTFLIPRIPGSTVQVHSSPLSRRTLPRRDLQSERKTETEPCQREDGKADGEPTKGQDTRKKKMEPPPALNFRSSAYLDEDWLRNMENKYAAAERARQEKIKEAQIMKKLLEQRRQCRLGNLDKKLRDQMRLFDEEPEVIEETPLPDVPQEKELPALTGQMEKEIKAALDGGPPTQVLVEGFRLQITRGDMATLRGLNWLNDEVINFYMNLLMERGGQEGFPKTYTFNTFFYPKLVSGGHPAVKRWTRRVDIFDHQYLVIPVHLGVHWCLCVVFMQKKKICYYDSMGGSNDQCLNVVRQYLHDESWEKKKQKLSLSEWSSEVVKDIPQQMNGSDCGMFSCMYAETITRGAKITFTQEDMPYFRRRMVYEILKKKLL